MTQKILSGKIAIITGANQGLGREISKSFVSAGADVMLCARNFRMLEETKQELNKLFGNEQEIYIKPKSCNQVTNKHDMVT